MPESHSLELPQYLAIPKADLGTGHGVQLRFVEGMADIARTMAEDMLASIRHALSIRGCAVLIIPVGPVDQFPILARMVNEQGLSLRNVVLINMDEYLTDGDQWVSPAHPLSFRSYMQRAFYDLLDPSLAPPSENRVFPDPARIQSVQEIIDRYGGVDACFAGVGINGHLAFNEPPEPGETMTAEAFSQLPTRVLSLSRETRTINANTVGGSLEVIPRRCVTVGMKEILESRRIEIYCNRPWQSAVIRRVLLGPVSADCPASLVRRHLSARATLASYVAEVPVIQLR